MYNHLEKYGQRKLHNYVAVKPINHFFIYIHPHSFFFFPDSEQISREKIHRVKIKLNKVKKKRLETEEKQVNRTSSHTIRVAG